MFPRFLLSAGLVIITAGAAHAQYVPTTYHEPYCREFTKAVSVGGQPQAAYGRACYQPDGAWQIVSDDIPRGQPVQYVPAQNQVIYVPQSTPRAIYSFNFNSYDPYRLRYYNNYGHGWRDRGRWDRHGYRHDRWRGRDWRGHGGYGWGHGHH